MTVLDASAVLVLLQDEPGADQVADNLSGARICSANLAEVVGKLVDVGLAVQTVRELLAAAGVTVEPLSEDDAVLAGALRALPGGTSLSLGDRCCLALAARLDATALTADRRWADLDIPVVVQLVR